MKSSLGPDRILYFILLWHSLAIIWSFLMNLSEIGIQLRGRIPKEMRVL